ncbi:DNA cytosine methyltransferase [Peribacillus frigoritolerans]|uniref:DNA cytosine methyltransferase n=1 Tax=Peribacillus frigoritolerans TaxID=450367 RepID=UPI00227ED15C|nr:DNA cytosine methyltransferase [Peribacillus frigoritolerans]MCY8938859.1 DNA cytosine methyltransferase [Peribacillus frigoritolerans]
MNAVSLFANIGVAEAYLKDIGINVVVANEIVKRRADLYSKIYPETEMITGDINDEKIFDTIVKECKHLNVEVVIATPPCQGMSTAGQQKKDDERNELILPVINLIKKIKPKYIFLENVPNLLNTLIIYKSKKVLIRELLKMELSSDYHIEIDTIDTKDYSVPQTRERAIVLMSKKRESKIWTLPDKDSKIVTMEEAIGDLPIIDPFVRDVSEEELLEMFPLFYERKKKALSISKWNNPPHHIKRQVEVMMHTPTGRTAFDNDYYIPRKENGEPVRGYRNTYKRQNWDTPAYTVTMDNRKISSQNNVHPGRYIGKDNNGDEIYSDPRALTVYELMIISSLPKEWAIPPNTPEAFLRSIIGEGIPPLFVKKTFEKL